MASHEKRRIQVQVDKELADNTEQVLQRLGLTQTTAITMLYKRIVATGAIPFELALTESEKATLHFLENTEDTPATAFKDAKAVEEWLNEDE
ncbi:type II toxin-antitoxin system RelB/DinJ family antitoxin [Lacticaseibacillus parahuelsenbergensis]|uniref:Type II toxin-antitoxin system RelB/DinJ family antitoxin n=1 Tax=Lacticaseibacillus parahuelsenbergensis TaxID=3068305 RepID=A0ABY9L1I8_9LACO|nr:type II toxin-antitoxin system RelB/DinJ family antitoxin [Lacticaseibacillus sp. NCIMB 15471]WLV77513.1 type II toxin-antitoxin system RelB/DinJ family antitoxin [Lacticaseibacillus sp. NCIMB 15471]